MTGVIGLFIVVACAATLHAARPHIHDAERRRAGARAARRRAPRTTLFGLGLVGAALLAAAIVPLSTAYSVAEAFGQPRRPQRPLREAPLFYGAYGASVARRRRDRADPRRAAGPDPLPLAGAQRGAAALAILPFLRGLARDPAVMGDTASAASGCDGGRDRLVAVSVVTLAVLSVV